MNQVWNIFLKDIRHLWREGAAAILLLAVFAWHDAQSWTKYHGLMATSGIGAIASFEFLAEFVDVLLPVAWALLIVRSVQSESLVGDRQFWITRPYEWPKLLTAKILFLLAFINLPLLVADLWLLTRAGYPPAHYLIGLLWMQCLITLALILPGIALSALTRSIAQLLLALLLLALYMIGMGWTTSQIPGAGSPVSGDSFSGLLALAACVLVIALQYARRWATKSRMVIAAVALAALIILVATPYRALMAREYPSGNQEPPLQLNLLHIEPAKQRFPSQNIAPGWIGMPMSVSGLSPDSIVVIDAAMLDVDAAGLSWNSDWVPVRTTLFPETQRILLNFQMKKSLFDRLRSVSINGKISIAFSLYRDMNKQDFVVPAGDFVLPEVGHCFAGPRSWREIQCIAPLRHPRSLLITSDASQTTCPLNRGESPAPPGELARDWSHSYDFQPAEFGISPIKDVNFAVAIPQRAAGLCPGTPVVLSNPERIRRGQTTIQLEKLRLPEYLYAATYAAAGLDVESVPQAEAPTATTPPSGQKPH